MQPLLSHRSHMHLKSLARTPLRQRYDCPAHQQEIQQLLQRQELCSMRMTLAENQSLRCRVLHQEYLLEASPKKLVSSYPSETANIRRAISERSKNRAPQRGRKRVDQGSSSRTGEPKTQPSFPPKTT